MAVVAVSPSLAVAEERGEEVSRFSGKKVEVAVAAKKERRKKSASGFLNARFLK
jgi:hypothetical protein